MPHGSPEPDPRVPLQERLGHRFSNPALLEIALTHRALLNAPPPGERAESNERLEYLGDAVLGLVVAEDLVRRFPEADEGRLSRWRAGAVNEGQLARAARRLGLGAHLRLDRGEEKSGGRNKDSILADALEAVLGAVFIDGGYEAARAAGLRLLEATLEEVLAGEGILDPKTEIQERVQRLDRATPTYRLVSESGPDHDKIFEVEVRVGEAVLGRGRGRSKKEAEQEAARAALRKREAHGG